MTTATVAVRRVWHPAVGATLVALSALVAVAAWATGAGAAAVGLTAFLAMGAVAGYSVSGST